eukprot:g2480.t1
MCRRCKIVKPRKAFAVHNGLKDGLSTYCKDCYLQCQRESRKRNQEKHDKGDIKYPPKKQCKTCGKIKMRDAFGDRKTRKDGKRPNCKVCCALKEKLRRQAKRMKLNNGSKAVTKSATASRVKATEVASTVANTEVANTLANTGITNTVTEVVNDAICSGVEQAENSRENKLGEDMEPTTGGMIML